MHVYTGVIMSTGNALIGNLVTESRNIQKGTC